ncbi:ABC transporter permease [Paenibacillus sp. OSY-SE]|uniref:ABC transporter permease n=1 Tax=Paenibacillus sp. OSY-SE TaxID=1196323 RepID=UPI0003096FD1|nr:ABC transporter permease [Paenibacillus sp. OSY-SE]
MIGLWMSERERIWKKKRVLILCSAYLLILAIYIAKLIYSGVGLYDYGEGKAALHNLNLSWFVLQDMSFIIQAIILPIFAVSTLCDEIHSGCYRLYMLRPFRRYQHWSIKLIALLEVVLVFIIGTYVISMISGWIFLPHSQSAILYHTTEPIGFWEANLYTIKLYLMHVLTCLLMIMMSSVICFFVPVSVVAFMIIFCFPFLMSVINSEFIIMNNPFSIVLDVLSPTGHSIFWVYILGSLMVTSFISFVRWKTKSI